MGTLEGLRTEPSSGGLLFGRAEARVMPSESEISAFEDREEDGEWRVEYFDDDGGCYVAVFAGPYDRFNGQSVLAKPYMDNVNWTKGIDQKTGKPLEYDPTKDIQTYAGIGNLTPNQPLKKVCPSIAGGNNYWPSSYSPKTKLLYIPAMTACMAVAVDREKHTKERGWNGGSYTTDERIESNLTAVDPTTGEIKKNVHLRYPNYSGTLATGGGLVFLALLDGTVAAFDDTSLDEMWKLNVGSGFSAPPMTFETGGKQYIAIVSGPSPSARSRLINTPELKEQRNAIVLYVLGL
jgi:alcohol dehydrogenase (cytochrome c)